MAGRSKDGEHLGSTVDARAYYALDVRFPNQLQAEMIANYREISRL